MQSWLDLWSINWLMLVKGTLQLLILIGIIYFIYNRFIRRSQAEQLLKGVFVTLLLFVILWGLARVLQLPMLEVVFGASIQILFIGLIVIFQPELRRMLLYLGQSELFGLQAFISSTEEQKAEYLIQELVESVRFLSKSKRGALIVVESANNPGGEYLEAGTPIDAKLSTELILTIFHPNTPLHDGAVVISPDNRVTAAGVLLPLTEDPELSWQYGTRHRAAIGLTEISESRCIVISEETGTISLAQAGKLEKFESPDELRKALERMYHVTVNPQSRKLQIGSQISGLFGGDVISDRIQKIFNRGGKPSSGPASSAGEKPPKSGTGG